MNKIKCLIVDDESTAREILQMHFQQIPEVEIVGVCKNGKDTLEALNNNLVDLIFLDINMPILSGIDWLKNLKNAPSVIMTTAYEKYALESFQYNVLDYLVKPISLKRFLQAIAKVDHYHNHKTKDDVLFLKSEKQLKKILVNDILFAEAMQNYIKVVTLQETIIIHMSLKSFKDQLPEEIFIQTHKSFIIAKYKVDDIIDHQIRIGDYTIPISVRLRKSVLKNFNAH